MGCRGVPYFLLLSKHSILYLDTGEQNEISM
jgi:hypothetical protein